MPHLRGNLRESDCDTQQHESSQNVTQAWLQYMLRLEWFFQREAALCQRGDALFFLSLPNT